MENSKKVHVLTVRCTNEIKQHEIALFRGAVNAALGHDANVLFHNHQNDNFRYSYPLIQYKRIGGKAAIVCVNEGVDVAEKLLSLNNIIVKLGEKETTIELQKVVTSEISLCVKDKYHKFGIKEWMPFNAGNFYIYLHTESLVERIMMLQKIITGNILSMAKGLGITVEGKIDVVITKMEPPNTVKHKGVTMRTFDIEFMVNSDLPQHIGLGKGVSMGYGIVTHLLN